MNDLVRMLREDPDCCRTYSYSAKIYFDLAADEIERLRKELAQEKEVSAMLRAIESRSMNHIRQFIGWGAK